MFSADGLRYALMTVCAVKDAELVFYGSVIAIVSALIGVAIGLSIRRKRSSEVSTSS